jgi:BirA family biotin operon repressor/biotin-[acetyl-CoA-carboxylase] ligase
MSEPLAGGFFQATFLETVGSTSDEARARAEAGAPEGTMVVAARQEQGRGRAGRRWSSPPGNLYASVVLRPDCAPAIAAQLSFVSAVALAEALDALAPGSLDIRLKWPNDVLADGRKVAGILLESALSGERVAWVVVGIGLNLVVHPADSRWPATNLDRLGFRVSPRAALDALAPALRARYEAWRTGGFESVREAWLARAFGLGETIEIALGEERLAGRFAGIDASGALALALPGNETRKIAAGEIQVPAAA